MHHQGRDDASQHPQSFWYSFHCSQQRAPQHHESAQQDSALGMNSPDLPVLRRSWGKVDASQSFENQVIYD